jgi:hypothetical protein
MVFEFLKNFCYAMVLVVYGFISTVDVILILILKLVVNTIMLTVLHLLTRVFNFVLGGDDEELLDRPIATISPTPQFNNDIKINKEDEKTNILQVKGENSHSSSDFHTER